MRIRSIKPQFWINEKLGTVSRDARLLYIGLWNLADDRGVFELRPARIKIQLFPYDEEIETIHIGHWLKELELIGKITIFKEPAGYFGYIPTFLEHQEIKKPSQWTFSKELPKQDNLIHMDDILPNQLPTSTPLVGKELIPTNLVVSLGSRVLGSREKGIGIKSINTLVENSQKPESPDGVCLTQKTKKETNPVIKEIYDVMKSYLGYPDKMQIDPIPTYGKEGIAIKRMIARGVTKEDIISCWKQKVDYYKNSFVSMQYVNTDIGSWISNGRKFNSMGGNGHKNIKGVPDDDKQIANFKWHSQGNS